MKKIIFAMCLLLIIASCNKTESYAPSSPYDWYMNHSIEDPITGDKDITRLENKEVICYKYNAYNKGGLSCKWKEEGTQ